MGALGLCKMPVVLVPLNPVVYAVPLHSTKKWSPDGMWESDLCEQAVSLSTKESRVTRRE